MAVLDLDAPLPDRLRSRVPSRQQLLAHAVRVDAERWRRVIAEQSLPRAGELLAEEQWVTLTRGDVLRLAERDINSDNAVQLFYASQAWGLGPKARRLPTRVSALGRDGAIERLEDAWSAVREGRSPTECYEQLMTPRGQTRVYFFGAAFATKYLYFASGSSIHPRCLILDAVVAKKLRPCAWPGSPTTGWWSETYARYCELLRLWAHALDSAGSSIAPDQVEMGIFHL